MRLCAKIYHLFFHLLLLVVFYAFSFPVFSQSPRFFNYSVEQGLPSSETYDVMQDSKGFVWIATDRGAVRYNGYDFTVFTTNNGLPSNTVFSIYEDVTGKIWFLSFQSKLAYYENNKIHLYKYNHLLDYLTGTVNPRSLYANAKGDVYIGFDKHGLIHIDALGKREQLIETDTAIANKMFSRKIEGANVYGSLSYPSQGPVIQGMDVGSGEPYTVSKGVPIISVGHPSHTRRKNGTLIMGSTKGWIEYFPGKPFGVQTFPNEILRLYEDRDSCLWICTHHNGALQLFPNSTNAGQHRFHVLSNKSVTGVLHDNEGGYWFSTLENGVYYFPQFKILPVLTPMSNKKNEVTSITSGQSSVFVGYAKGIVEEMEGLTLVQKYSLIQKNDSAEYIHTLRYNSSAQELWCATSTGVRLIYAGKVKNISLPVCRSVLGIGPQECYFTNDFHLWKYNKGEKTDLIPQAPQMYIEQICLDQAGNVLMATLQGLYIYDTSKTLRRANNVLDEIRIKEIRNTGNGRIVFATLGKGVIIEEKGQLRVVDEQRGMASGFVNAISSGNDTIWAATTKGISRLILEGDRIRINNFDQYNGLPTNEIRKIHCHGDRVWLGTKEGLYCFRASQVVINRVGPKMFLEEVRVNEVPTNGRNVFSATENNFLFSFFAINYKKRGNIQYRYRLTGYDNKWKYTRNRNVQYLSLPDGEYSFEAQAENEDHYWSQAGGVFRFTVRKPFYLEWWFMALTVFFLVAVVYLLVRRRIKVIQHNNKVALLMNEYKNIALASQINPHFIFNSLNSIQSFIIYEDRISASKYLSAFARLMRKSLEHSRVDFVTVSEEMELLEMYLMLEQLRFKNKFGHQFQIDPSVEVAKIQVPSMILQPFIENSIRHGLNPKEGEDGMVIVRLFFEGELLRCEIIDNGVGRKSPIVKNKEEVKHTSYGIDITVERIKTYCRHEKTKFHFAIEDKFDDLARPAGTKVIFYLPYKKVLYET